MDFFIYFTGYVVLTLTPNDIKRPNKWPNIIKSAANTILAFFKKVLRQEHYLSSWL